MWMNFAKLMAGLSLLLQASIGSAQIFQWTDAKGVIHFTDNPYSIPESIRNSSSLIVRKDLDTRSASSPTTFEARSVPENPRVTSPSDADADAWQTATTVTTHAPQELNIVVVNSDLRVPDIRPCKFGSDCKPVFRPDFTDRRYIHPSVFDDGSRQNIRPWSSPLSKSQPLNNSRRLSRSGSTYPRRR
jgi:Domain of unknown function (DUF4124)